MSDPNPPYDYEDQLAYRQPPAAPRPYSGQQPSPYSVPAPAYSEPEAVPVSPPPPPPPPPSYEEPPYGAPYGTRQNPDWAEPTPIHGLPSPDQWTPQPYHATAPKLHGSLWSIIGIGVGVLALLWWGGSFFFHYPVNPFGGTNSAANPGPGGVATPTVNPSPTRKVTVTLALPDKIGDRKKITDEQHAKAASETETNLKKDARITSTVIAYYGTTDPLKDKVYLQGMGTTAPMSKSTFDTNFAALSKDPMTDVVDIDPGPHGGHAKCGALKIQEVPVAACAWGDEGSFVIVMWYNQQVTDEVKAELLAIRGEVETKTVT